MIGDPRILVECDEPGCGNNEEMSMAPLARGAFDDRHIEQELERLGWVIDGEVTTCPEHQEDDEDEE